MTTDRKINIGVIGLGFMGGTHISAYLKAGADGFGCSVAAVCDSSEERLRTEVKGTGNVATGAKPFDPRSVTTYSCVDDLLKDPSIDLVSICTPTLTHTDVALRAIAAGKHVLIEKPVALRVADVRRIADAARGSGRLCMPAMCMRFWPAWTWLKRAIADGRFGPVISASFTRLATIPRWSDAYTDPARTGGALIDLHIHFVAAEWVAQPRRAGGARKRPLVPRPPIMIEDELLVERRELRVHR